MVTTGSDHFSVEGQRKKGGRKRAVPWVLFQLFTQEWVTKFLLLKGGKNCTEVFWAWSSGDFGMEGEHNFWEKESEISVLQLGKYLQHPQDSGTQMFHNSEKEKEPFPVNLPHLQVILYIHLFIFKLILDFPLVGYFSLLLCPAARGIPHAGGQATVAVRRSKVSQDE